MYKQPLLILAVSFILGIFFRDFFSFSPFSANFLLVVAFFSTAAVYSFQALPFWRHFGLVFLFFSVGVFSHQLNTRKPAEVLDLKNPTVVFQLKKKLNSNEKNKRYEIKIVDIQDSGASHYLPLKAVVSVPKSEKDLDFAHFYRSKVYLNRVEEPLHDYQFNYAKYLSRKNIFYQAYIPEGFQKTLKQETNLADQIRQWRMDVLRKIDSLTITPRSREFLKGIILADRTEMDAQTVEDFNRSGLVHLLAISGSHMAIIFWLLLLFLKPLFTGKYRFLPIIIAIVFIWLFAILIDFGSSVVRSCLMISVYYAAVILQRKPDLLHAMGLSALLILLYDTHQLFDVGFQLSYLAVFGIFWLNKPLKNWLPQSRNRLGKFLLTVVSVTVAAQIATLPLVLYYFHQFSIMSFPANLVIIPMAEIILVSSLFLTVFTAAGVSISWFHILYDTFISFILKVIHYFAGVNVGFSDTIAIGLPEVLLLLLAIYILRYALLSPTHKNLIRLLTVLVVFSGLRFSLNAFYINKEEVVKHQIFKEKMISAKNKDKVWFYMPRSVDRKRAEKFVLKPYLISVRGSKYETIIVPDSVNCLNINKDRYCFSQ